MTSLAHCSGYKLSMNQSPHNSWLHRFAVLTALATLALLGIGGLVTSHGAGMAVPDWPTSYGYNMFALPFHFWKGGVFYEHSHRLVASGVGMLTMILAVWLWFSETRRWMRWLGVIALVAVVLQGVLGGLRVVWFKDQIGIIHATLAQLFFALVCAIALFTSRWWVERRPPARLNGGLGQAGSETGAPLRWLFLATTILIFLQLIIAATMRHEHAGLAISDFPLAHDKLWPDMSDAAVERYNQQRMEVVSLKPITAFQIGLQMAHRIVAVMILIGVAACVWRGARTQLKKLTFTWLGLILVQIALGAWTIWSNKAADVATAHVLVGAFSLVTGVLGCIICNARLAGNKTPHVVGDSQCSTIRTVSV